jgi:transposase
VVEIIRKLGISEQTFYRWKKKYAGLGIAELRRLKQLEEENRKLKQLVTGLRQQQDQLLSLRLLEEINETTFSNKSTELRDRIAEPSLEFEACDRRRADRSELAEKAFELSQSLAEKWVKADVAAKRQLREIV